MKIIFALVGGLLGLCCTVSGQLQGDTIKSAMELAWQRQFTAPSDGQAAPLWASTNGEAQANTGPDFFQRHPPTPRPSEWLAAPFSIQALEVPGRVRVTVEDPHTRITEIRMLNAGGKPLWEEHWPAPGLAPLEFDIYLLRYPKGDYQLAIGTETGTWTYDWTRP